MPRNTTSDDNDDESMDLTEVHSEPVLAPGHHVFVEGEHNSGPYADEAAAQAFIDGHLGGEGEVRLIDESENEE